MNQIKNRWTEKVICHGEESIKTFAIKNRADLVGADLRDADLVGADLRDADLRGADLRDADLVGADLRDADLVGADLRGAYLRGAYLGGADLRGADLVGADLRGADLRDADLRGAYLGGADLRDAKIEFHQFPSIRLLSSMDLGALSDDLTTELFRRDMNAHPKPELFEAWAKNNGLCPYKNEERFWFFELRKECWKPGKPQMKDSDLILAICKEKGWKIKGYLT